MYGIYFCIYTYIDLPIDPIKINEIHVGKTHNPPVDPICCDKTHEHLVTRHVSTCHWALSHRPSPANAVNMGGDCEGADDTYRPAPSKGYIY